MKHQRALNSPYNIDFWKEVKKRWMVAGLLAAVLLAVISPRFGAPGGKQTACSLLDHSRTHCTHPTISSSQPIYVPLLGTGLLSEQEGLRVAEWFDLSPLKQRVVGSNPGSHL
ncbi:hypothetical protein MSG28_015527 [Choristoneura fumiferana]|uniref:Uncharacterized protein n=1 Tax=Choristoneura fumiferana TaxID=7141 RepID=A0ACC0KB11_CHOFU|nr:hypothetical protein MSG28_015527 [Choristoneura fumiferana]